MARVVEIVVPPHETEALVAEARAALEDLVGLQVSHGGSHQPPGDVVTLTVTNRSLYRLMRILERRGVGTEPGRSITISEPAALVSQPQRDAIENDHLDVGWEEMDFTIMRESTMRMNGLLVMGGAGVLAAVGIASGALHLVIAAMVIAPGFEPLTRIALGLVARSAVWRPGLRDTARGYGALLAGALLGAVFMHGQGEPLLTAGRDYLASEALIRHWIDFSPKSLLIAAVAGSTGAILIANNRSVLTAGVLIAHSLIPPVAVAGAALVAGNFELAATSGLRWALEATVVVVTGLLVFSWKRAAIQKRGMMV
jgi:hypothetical protein